MKGEERRDSNPRPSDYEIRSVGVGWTMWSYVPSRFRGIGLRRDRLESVGHVAPSVVPRRLPSEAAMGDLVDARLPRLSRVSLAHRDQHQGRLAGIFVAGENRAPLASRLRNVELD